MAFRFHADTRAFCGGSPGCYRSPNITAGLDIPFVTQWASHHTDHDRLGMQTTDVTAFSLEPLTTPFACSAGHHQAQHTLVGSRPAASKLLQSLPFSRCGHIFATSVGSSRRQTLHLKRPRRLDLITGGRWDASGFSTPFGETGLLADFSAAVRGCRTISEAQAQAHSTINWIRPYRQHFNGRR